MTFVEVNAHANKTILRRPAARMIVLAFVFSVLEPFAPTYADAANNIGAILSAVFCVLALLELYLEGGCNDVR